MKHAMYVILGIAFLLCMNIDFVDAQEVGCCINPNAKWFFALCGVVPEEQCCGSDQDCIENNFYQGESCYDEYGNTDFAECEAGCCCSENDKGVVYSEITTKLACDGIFDSNIANPTNCLQDCGGETYEVTKEDQQCMHYYCKGDTFPEGPIPSKPSELVNVKSVYPEIDGRITAAVEIQNRWLITENNYLYLYNKNDELIQNGLELHGLDQNPTKVSDLFTDSNMNNLEAMAALAEIEDSAGKIYYLDDERVYRYSKEGFSELYSIKDIDEIPSEIESMSTYGSFNFENYILLLGHNDLLNFYQPYDKYEPFSGLSKIDVISPTSGHVDAVMEIDFPASYPCLLLFGECGIAGSCTADDECTDFNECTDNICKNGKCHFPAKDDMTSCMNGGTCCGGICYSDAINHQFHGNCRTDSFCEDGFLKYDADNEDNVCAGECKTCNKGFCLDNNAFCEEPGECCKNGQCVECTNNCESEGQIICKDNQSYQVCEETTVDGTKYKMFSEIKTCDSNNCYESFCNEGSGEDAGCVFEPIEEGKQDPGKCFNEQGCQKGNCRCDGEGNCVSMCVNDNHCIGGPCKEGSCVNGECEFSYSDGEICYLDEKAGICANGNCQIPECSQGNECQSAPACYKSSCEDNQCIYAPSKNGTECTTDSGILGKCDGNGNCEFIECNPNADAEEQCPGSPSKESYCTSEGYCEYTSDENKDSSEGESPYTDGDQQTDDCVENGCSELNDMEKESATMSLECEYDEDCQNKNSCQIGACVNKKCEFKDKQDGTSCLNGVCCGGVCQTDVENKNYNKSCRIKEPQCVGGNYQYIASNNGEICAGECAICVKGNCYSNSSMCSEGQECINGKCTGCQDKCQEGNTRCLGKQVQTCEEINGCLTWGDPKSCSEGGKCTKTGCASGECFILNVEKGGTDDSCYSHYGCEGENCECDGTGNCVINEEQNFGPMVAKTSAKDDDDGTEVISQNGNSPALASNQDKSSYLWIILLFLALIIVGVLFWAYRKGSLGASFKNLISKLKNPFSHTDKQPLNAQNNPTKNAPKLGQRETTNLRNELLNYLQTLRSKGPDKAKEIELMKKGATSSQLKELYNIVRRENQKKANRKKKISNFD